MSFQKLPGNKGLIYVPDCIKCPKKHPCRECFCCQWCGNERCRVCRPQDFGPEKVKKPGKISR
ncbi:MAG: hypothetical protein SCH71_05025 [Desulfobulbaceae bacterium]|nr:hypothetical protein [Desulfobulbaceae bacterium]